MANLRDIKKRIKSVKNTQQITKAMKMVSAAKLRRAEESVKQARPYANKMLGVLSSLALRADSSAPCETRSKKGSGHCDHLGQRALRRIQFRQNQEGGFFPSLEQDEL